MQWESVRPKLTQRLTDSATAHGFQVVRELASGSRLPVDGYVIFAGELPDAVLDDRRPSFSVARRDGDHCDILWFVTLADDIVHRRRITDLEVQHAFADWLGKLTGGTPIRRERLNRDEAGQVRAALEPTLAAIRIAADEGRMPDHVEHDIRILLRQLHEWSQLLEPTSQGFEHILSEITRRIIDNTSEPHSMRHRLLQLGADPTIAAAVDASVRDALNAITFLGDDDNRADGDRLADVAEHVDRLERQLEAVTANPPASGELADAIRKGAGTEVGRRSAGIVIDTVIGNWDKIRLGLALTSKWVAMKLLGWDT